MAHKIVSLTDEQSRRMPAWVEKWVAIGRSCEPANFVEAERGVRGCYRVAGLTEPEIVLHMSSPYAAVCAGPIATIMLGAQVRAQVRDQVRAQVEDQVWDQVLDQVLVQVRAQVGAQVGDQVRAQVGDQVWDQVLDQVLVQVRAQVGAQVGDQVRAQVGDQVRAQVRDQVRAQVEDHVWAQVRDQVRAQVEDHVGDHVWDQVRAQVEDHVWAQVRDQVRAQVEDHVGDHVWDQVWAQVRAQARAQANSREAIRAGWHRYRGGNLWAGWYAYVTFLRDVAGWSGDTLDKFQWDELHATHAGWCWYGTKVAAISDRPERLLFDESGSLHCEDGMAVCWRDGWGLWVIHGIRVDEQIVMRPETQTIQQINDEENADIKSIRIDRFGWPRYLKETGARLIDHRHNDIENTMEALYDSPDGSRRLVATCPTGRVFVMGCPSDVETCAQAQNWLGGDDLGAKSRCLGRT